MQDELSPALVEARDMLLSTLTGRYYGKVRVDVASTAKLRSLARVRPRTPYKEFKPLLFTSYARSYIVPLTVVVLMFCFVPAGQVTYLMLILAALMIATNLISDNRKSHCIRIDAGAIAFEGDAYSWGDIAETAILTGRVHVGSKSARDLHYMVLVFRQGGYRQFGLEHYAAFWGLCPELSRYIEYFKAAGSPAAPGSPAANGR